MRTLCIIIAFGCGSHGAHSTDASSTSIDASAIDASATSDGASVHGGIPTTMFSINWPTDSVVAPKRNNPWPTSVGADYGSLRTWGSIVDWNGIEPNPCADPTTLDTCWVWTQLDAMVADTHGIGVDELHFVTADYPPWSNGSGTSATLPTDITSTTACTAIPAAFRTAAGLAAGDCSYQGFVFALAMHSCATCNAATGPWQGAMTIRSFSPGNEVNGKGYVDPPCSGSATTPCAQVARMASDLYKIVKYVDATVVVGTPSFTQLDGSDAMRNYFTYASAYGDIADVDIFHIYGQNGEIGAGMPEVNWTSRIAGYSELAPGKPMWVDEGGWGQNFQTNSAGQACGSSASDCGCSDAPIAACMDADNVGSNELIDGLLTAPPAGYLVRGYLAMLAGGVQRFYWYAPGADEWGSFADCAGGSACTNTPTSAAFAWASMYRWLVGATLGTLAQTGSQYTYPIAMKDSARPTGCGTIASAPANYHALIAWDTAGASTFDCTGYSSYCTLFEGSAAPFGSGAAHPCSGSVQLGPNPILLEP
jgi:hypothetical protein